MVGNAAIDAAKKLKAILVDAAARKLEARPDDIEVAGEVFRIDSGQQASLPFAEVVKAALVDRGAITVSGTFTCSPESQGGRHKGGAVGSTMGFSYAAQVVEVSIDDATGVVSVDKVWAALDCGHAINPLAVEGKFKDRYGWEWGKQCARKPGTSMACQAMQAFLSIVSDCRGIPADRGPNRGKP